MNDQGAPADDKAMDVGQTDPACMVHGMHAFNQPLVRIASDPLRLQRQGAQEERSPSQADALGRTTLIVKVISRAVKCFEASIRSDWSEAAKASAKAAKQAGLPPVPIHAARHTFCAMHCLSFHS